MEKKHPLLKDFIEYKINKQSSILEELKGIDSQKGKIRLEEIEELMSQYKEVLKAIEG